MTSAPMTPANGFFHDQPNARASTRPIIASTDTAASAMTWTYADRNIWSRVAASSALCQRIGRPISSEAAIIGKRSVKAALKSREPWASKCTSFRFIFGVQMRSSCLTSPTDGPLHLPDNRDAFSCCLRHCLRDRYIVSNSQRADLTHPLAVDHASILSARAESRVSPGIHGIVLTRFRICAATHRLDFISTRKVGCDPFD